MKYLYIAVITFLLVAQSVHAFDTLESLESHLQTLCLAKCDMVLKDDSFCKEFCRFTKHIMEQHGEKLIQLHKEGLTNNPLDWGMDDVVRYRARNHIEDDHYVGEMFFESVYKYNLFEKRKNEL